ncbi:hypothetical protein F938_00817 [Acinetobacter bereziniae LMG 1003 = CIP 70.12]|uniref:Uncharacterized protein n=1 Tax=Acinetobacter bereziniae LMG 1003 = CIP 70.12 TaxID=981324 RepID=N9DPJ8_ACIBZ|nr:hypothetical protein [Acinetobacter bereziniae]ENW00173.1 hypothetical protein F938_00817 [Acinetobacter bereziniae LMG 1003 = CIP 70.12]
MIKITDQDCYQHHKDTLENYEATKHLAVFNITENRANDIQEALLKYRRENNIFEVGDYVVYKSNAGLEGLFQIETLTKTGKPKTVKTKRFGNFPCRYCEVQHATPEEIKAGHRLEAERHG